MPLDKCLLLERLCIWGLQDFEFDFDGVFPDEEEGLPDELLGLELTGEILSLILRKMLGDFSWRDTILRSAYAACCDSATEGS